MDSFYPLSENKEQITAPGTVSLETTSGYQIFWGAEAEDDAGLLFSVQLLVSGGKTYNYLTGHEDFSVIPDPDQANIVTGMLNFPSSKIGTKPKLVKVTVWDISKAENGIITKNGNLAANIPWVCDNGNSHYLNYLCIPQDTTYTTPIIYSTKTNTSNAPIVDLTDVENDTYFINYDSDFLKNENIAFKNMVEYSFGGTSESYSVNTSSYIIEKSILAQNTHQYYTVRASGIIKLNDSILYSTDAVSFQIKYTPNPIAGRLYETNNSVYSYTPIIEDQAIGVYNETTATHYDFYFTSWSSTTLLSEDCGQIFATVLNNVFPETETISASGISADITITKTTTECSLGSGMFIFGAKGINTSGESEFFTTGNDTKKIFVFDGGINDYVPANILYPGNNSTVTDARVTARLSSEDSLNCEFFIYEKVNNAWTQILPIGGTTSTALEAGAQNNVFIGTLRDNTDYCLVALCNVTTTKIPTISYFRIASKGTRTTYVEAEAIPAELIVDTKISNKVRYAVGIKEVAAESNIYERLSTIIAKPRKLKRKAGKIILSCNALYDKKVSNMPAKFYVSLDKETTWTRINPINFEQTADENGEQIPVVLFVNSVFNENSRVSLKSIYGKNCFLDVSDSGYFTYKVILLGDINNANYSPMLETIKFKIIYQ